MSLVFWFFIVALLWAITVTVFCFIRNPLPFPDRGHRCFAVSGAAAVRPVLEILGQLGGLPERFSFDPGPTHQTLVWDNTTVIIHHDAEILKSGLPLNAISLVVGNPRTSAQAAVKKLHKAGFYAQIKYDVIPGVGDKFVLVTSNAFCGWVLAFRRHVLKMGGLPNKHRVTV